MILVERGELDIDAPVRRYLPKLALADDDVAERVTMRHLLTHTAGWVGDYFADHGAGDDALERMLGDLPRLPQLTPLGQVWSYNNAGFYIAGRVVEVVGGAPFELLVQRLLFEPLGLEHSLFFTEDVMTRRFAAGHHRSDDGPPTVARPWAIGRAHHAAGGISSTVVDLLRYARFHLTDGEGILTRASLDEMQRPHLAAAPIFGSVGLTWGIDDVTGVRLVHHGGGTNGQVAHLSLAPDSQTVLAVLTNAQRGGEVVQAALDRVVDALGGRKPERISVILEPAEYLGTYRLAAAGRRAGQHGRRPPADHYEPRRLPDRGLSPDAEPTARHRRILRARPAVHPGRPGCGHGGGVPSRPGRPDRVAPLRRPRHAAASLSFWRPALRGALSDRGQPLRRRLTARARCPKMCQLCASRGRTLSPVLTTR